MYGKHVEKIENKPPKTKSSMKSVKLQDTRLICRNLLFFYTLIANYQKEKLRKQFHL